MPELHRGALNGKKAARESLRRTVPFTLTRQSEGGGTDGLTIEGYGAVFNAPTRIDSWEGCFDEVIAPGAFKKTVREQVIRMQFDHGQHPLLGSLPLGRWDVAEEDAHGLHLVGRLNNNWLTEPFRDAIREGGVDGMSFRFSVIKEEWRDSSGKVIKNEEELWDLLFEGERSGQSQLTRTLKEVRCTEAGPVVWPAYDSTSVGVRSKVTIDLGRLNDPEQRRLLAETVAFASRAVGLVNDAEDDHNDDESVRTDSIEPLEDKTPAVEDHSEEEQAPDTEVSPAEHSSDLDARTRRDNMKRRARELRKIAYTIRPLDE
jgi:HK97 family phage prohead protease